MDTPTVTARWFRHAWVYDIDAGKRVFMNQPPLEAECWLRTLGHGDQARHLMYDAMRDALDRDVHFAPR